MVQRGKVPLTGDEDARERLRVAGRARGALHRGYEPRHQEQGQEQPAPVRDDPEAQPEQRESTLWFQDRRPVLAAALLGIGVLAAGLLKWTALAFAPPMLVGVLLCRSATGGADGAPAWSRRALALVAGSLLLLALLWVWLAVVPGSLDSTWSGSLSGAGTEAPGQAMAPGLGKTSLRLLTLQPGLGGEEAARLGLYGLRLVTSLLSPLGCAVILALLVPWIRSGAPGWPLVVAVISGHVVFLCTIVEPIDDRFLLTLAPGLLLAAALGWARLGPRAAVPVAGVAIAVGLGVAADFHLAGPHPLNRPVPVAEPFLILNGTNLRGVGLASSTQGRGWLRADEENDSRWVLRERTWSHLRRCSPQHLVIPRLGVFGLGGARAWWDYRVVLDLIEGVDEAAPPPAPVPALAYVDASAWDWRSDPNTQAWSEQGDALEPVPDPLGTGLLLQAEGAGLEREVPIPGGAAWVLARRIEAEDGGPGVEIWMPEGSGLCPR